MNKITAENIYNILENYEFVTHTQRTAMREFLKCNHPEEFAQYEQNITDYMENAFKSLKR